MIKKPMILVFKNHLIRWPIFFLFLTLNSATYFGKADWTPKLTNAGKKRNKYITVLKIPKFSGPNLAEM